MAKNASRKAGDPFDLEQAMSELESIVEAMEHGDLPLEEALKSFERGVQLSGACNKALNEAEQKVRLLTERSGIEKLVSFAPLEDESDADEDDDES